MTPQLSGSSAQTRTLEPEGNGIDWYWCRKRWEKNQIKVLLDTWLLAEMSAESIESVLAGQLDL